MGYKGLYYDHDSLELWFETGASRYGYLIFYFPVLTF
jgi:hypothetical protein